MTALPILQDVYRVSDRLMHQICAEMDLLKTCAYGQVKATKGLRDTLVNQYFALLDQVLATQVLQQVPEAEKERFKARQLAVLEKMEDHHHLVTGHMRAQERIIETYARMSQKQATLGYTAAGRERSHGDMRGGYPTVVSMNSYF